MLATLFLTFAAQGDAAIAKSAVEPNDHGFLENFINEISLRGEFMVRKDDWDAVDQDGNEINDKMRLRQVSLDVRGTVVEDVEAFIALSLFGAPVNDFDAELEEAWLESGDFLPDSSWEWNMRIGRFRSSFGRLGEERAFDLPQPTRPFAQQHFLGERGFVQTGLSTTFQRPPTEDASGWSFTIEALDGGDLPIVETSGDEAFATVLDLEWSFLPADRYLFEAGVSTYRGKQNGLRGDLSHMFGVDLLLGRAADPTTGTGAFHIGAEFYRADLERMGRSTDRPMGGFLWAQTQVSREWFLGIRLDTAEDLEFPHLDTQRYGIYAHYVRWERLRLGLGWESTVSDFQPLDTGRTFLIQVEFGLGRDMPRPFWLGR